MIIYRAALCVQIIHPQMTRMTQILYFFSADDKDMGEAPLKNPCYLRHLRMKFGSNGFHCESSLTLSSSCGPVSAHRIPFLL